MTEGLACNPYNLYTRVLWHELRLNYLRIYTKRNA